MKLWLGSENIDTHYIHALFTMLQHASVDVEYCPGKAGAIYLDGRPVAFVCYADFDQIPEHQAKFIRDNGIKTVLKYVYNSGTDYTGVGVPVIPFGYVAPGMFSMCPYGEFVPFAGRKYNLMAHMRTHQGNKSRANREWSRARRALVEQAGALSGYAVLTDKVDLAQYLQELALTQIGINWRGCSRLCFRLVEFLRFGVCMISDDVGDCVFSGGTRLEAGTHYIKCSTTDEFTALFNSTILDVKRMEEIGRAGYDFYLAHLSPQKWGNTFWPG